MTLSPAQLATLKAYIDGQPDLSVIPNTTDGAVAIADLLDLVASPDFLVWRTSVSRDELVGSTSVDGTSFSWTGSGFITRSVGERDAFAAIFSSAGTVNPSMLSVRQAFNDIFSGATAPAPANRTHLLTVARRKANRGERVFATGTGSTASPGLLVVEGSISAQDVMSARNLP